MRSAQICSCATLLGCLLLAGSASAGGVPVHRLPQQGVWLCHTTGRFDPSPRRPARLVTLRQKGTSTQTTVHRIELRPATVREARRALKRGSTEPASEFGHRSFWIARGAGKTRHAQLVRIERRLNAQPIHVWSIDNANKRYWLRFSLRRAPAKASWPCLVLAGQLSMASSVGSSGKRSHRTGFNLPRKLADAAAKRYRLTRGDRRDLTPALRFGCAPVKARVKAGQPLMMRFTASSSAKQAVYIGFGGAYRGSGRNNRFSFAVSDAKGRTIKDVGRTMNFGGRGGVAPVARGKPHRVDVDLRKWTGALKPGTYRVRCSYDVALAARRDLTWKQGHLRWNAKPQTTSTLTVLP
jgi:hypothetical protein